MSFRSQSIRSKSFRSKFVQVIPVAALAATLGVAAGGCDVVPASNGFDPQNETSPTPGSIFGQLVFDVETYASPFTIELLNSDGQRVQVAKTLVAGDQPISGINDAAGAFEIIIPDAGTYSLRFIADIDDALADPNDNNKIEYRDVVARGIDIFPGVRQRVDLTPSRIPADEVSGSVEVTVAGTEPGHSYVLVLESESGSEVLPAVGDGTYSFSRVRPGNYRVRAEGDAYLPQTSTEFPVASQTVSQTINMQVLGDFFRPVTPAGATLPFVATRELLLEVAPLVLDDTDVVAQVRAAETLAGDTLSCADAPTGEAGSWQAYGGQISVSLDAGDDGERTVQAQLRLCIGDRAVQSAITQITYVYDTTAPRADQVTVGGIPGTIDSDTTGVGTATTITGPALTLACADFGTSCPPAADALPPAVVIEALVSDAGGSVVDAIVTLDDEAAPAFSAGSGAGPLKQFNLVAPAIAASAQGPHTLRLWARDAAGNVSPEPIHTREIVLDTEPLTLAAAPLSHLSGTLTMDVDGTPTEVIPGNVVSVLPVLDDIEDEAIASWRVVNTDQGGSNFQPFDGSALSLFFEGPHRDDVTLIVEVKDAAGNLSRGDPEQLFLWRAGDIEGLAALEDGVAPSVITVTLTPSTGDATPLTTSPSADGTVFFGEVPVGNYILSMSAAGYTSTSDVVTVVSATTATFAPTVLFLPHGEVAGQFVLQGQEDSSTNNAGIQVTLFDTNNTAIRSTATLPDGSWFMAPVRATTGYTVRASSVGFVTQEIFGVSVAQNQRTDVPSRTLSALSSDFSLCAPSPTLQATCDILTATNLDTVQVAIDASGTAEYRIGLETFAATDPFLAFADGPPRVTFPSEGSFTVFLQRRQDTLTEPGPILEANIIFDQTPPQNVVLTLERGPAAILDGYTNVRDLDFIVTAEKGNGSDLSGSYLTVADSPPGAADSSTAPSCGHGTSCRIKDALLQGDGLYRAWASSCDQAGNCSDFTVGLDAVQPGNAGDVILLDTTAPSVTAFPGLVATGADYAADVVDPASQFDGTSYFMSVREHDMRVHPGVALEAGPDGNPAPEIAAVRTSLQSDLSDAALVFLDGSSVVNVDRIVNVGVPPYTGGTGEFTVYAAFTDPAGNETAVGTSSDHSYVVTFDNSAPRVSVQAPAITNDCQGSVDVVTTDTESNALVSVDVFTPDGTPVVSNAAGASSVTSTLAVAPTLADCNDPLAIAASSFPDGDYQVSAVAIDRAFNQAQVSTTVRVDRTPPVIDAVTCSGCGVVTDEASGAITYYSKSTTTNFTLNTSDGLSGVATVTPIVDGNVGTAVPVGSVVPVSLTVEGMPVSVVLRATDRAGNSRDSAPLSLVLDTLAPSVAVTPSNGATLASAQVVLTLDISGESAGGAPVTQMRVSGTGDVTGLPFAAFTPSVSVLLSPATDGIRNVALQVRDAAGNTTPISRTFTLDGTAPTGTLEVEGGATVTNSTTVTVTALGGLSEAAQVVLINAGDDCGQVDFSAAPAATTTINTTHTLADADGVRTVKACLLDAAGNTATLTDSILLDRSGIGGAVLIDSGALFTTDTALNLELFADADIDKVSVGDETLDCATAPFLDAFTTTRTQPISGADGTYTVKVCFRDTAGNITESTDSIVLDTKAPDATLTARAFSNVQEVILGVTPIDADLAFVSAQESATALDCTAVSYVAYAGDIAFTLADLDGVHTVRVCFKDPAGLTTQGSVSITLDRVAPTNLVLDVAGGAALSTSNPVAMSLTATDATSSVRFSLTVTSASTGGVQSFSGAIASAPTSVTLDAEGAHTFAGQVTDAAGNITPLSPVTVTLDQTAPCATAASVSFGGAFSSNALVSGTIGCTGETPDLMQVACDGTLDTEDVVPFATTFVCDYADGAQTVAVSLLDDAGNTTSAGTDSTTVDTVAPAIASFVVASGASIATSDPVSLDLSASDSTAMTYALTVAPVGSLVVGLETSGLVTAFPTTTALGADGTYDVSVVLTDAAGNTTTANTQRITLDTTPPCITSAVLSLAGGNAFTNSSTVVGEITCVGEDPTHIQIACDGTVDTEPVQAYANTFTCDLTEGAQTVQVKITDNAGNGPVAFSATTTVDLTPPVVSKFDLASGTRLFNNSTPALTLLSTDTNAQTFQLNVANLGDGTVTTVTGDASAPPANISLSAEAVFEVNGTVTDVAGNTTTLGTIVVQHDATPPCATSAVLTLGSGATYATSSVVGWDLVCTGETPDLMTIGCDGTVAGKQSAPFAFSSVCALVDGSNTVVMEVSDAAGNTTTVTSDSIIVDRTPPTIPRLTEASELTSSTSFSITALAVASTDAGSGLAIPAYEVNAPGITAANCATVISGASFNNGWCSWDGTASFNVPLSVEGENRIRVRANDLAGNVGDDDVISVTLDTTAPRTPRVSSLKVAGGDVLVEFASNYNATETINQVDHFLVYYALSDALVADGVQGATFLDNGVSPLNLGLSQSIRLIGTPLDQTLFVRVSAVDAAGNESERSAITSADVTAAGIEIFSSESAGYVAPLDDNGTIFLEGTGNGFDIISWANLNAPVVSTKFDVRSTGVIQPEHGALFLAAGPPPAQADTWVWAAVAVKARGAAARFGDLLVYAIGKQTEVEAGTVLTGPPKLVRSYPLIGPVVDVQAADDPDGNGGVITWLEHHFRPSENAAVFKSVRSTDNKVHASQIAEISLNSLVRPDAIGMALVNNGAQAIVTYPVNAVDGFHGAAKAWMAKAALTQVSAPAFNTPIDLIDPSLSTTCTGAPGVANVANVENASNPVLTGRGEPVQLGAGAGAWFSVVLNEHGNCGTTVLTCARRVTLNAGASEGISVDGRSPAGLCFSSTDDKMRFAVKEFANGSAMKRTVENRVAGRKNSHDFIDVTALDEVLVTDRGLTDQFGAEYDRGPVQYSPVNPWLFHEVTAGSSGVLLMPRFGNIGTPIGVNMLSDGSKSSAGAGDPTRRSPEGFDVVNGFVFTGEDDASNSRLAVWDYTWPDRPKRVTTLALSAAPKEFAHYQNLLYAASRGKIFVIDITNPFTPVLVQTVTALNVIAPNNVHMAVGQGVPGYPGPFLFTLERTPGEYFLARYGLNMTVGANYGKMTLEGYLNLPFGNSGLPTSILRNGGIKTASGSILALTDGTLVQVCQDFGNATGGSLSGGLGSFEGATSSKCMTDPTQTAKRTCLNELGGQPISTTEPLCSAAPATGSIPATGYISAFDVDGADVFVVAEVPNDPIPARKRQMARYALVPNDTPSSCASGTDYHTCGAKWWHAVLAGGVGPTGNLVDSGNREPIQRTALGAVTGISPPTSLLATTGAILLAPVTPSGADTASPGTIAIRRGNLSLAEIYASGRFVFEDAIEEDGVFYGLDRLSGLIAFGSTETTDLTYVKDLTPTQAVQTRTLPPPPPPLSPLASEQNRLLQTGSVSFGEVTHRGQSVLAIQQRVLKPNGTVLIPGKVKLIEVDETGVSVTRGIYPDPDFDASVSVKDAVQIGAYVVVAANDGISDRLIVLHAGPTGHGNGPLTTGFGGACLAQKDVYNWGPCNLLLSVPTLAYDIQSLAADDDVLVMRVAEKVAPTNTKVLVVPVARLLNPTTTGVPVEIDLLATAAYQATVTPQLMSLDGGVLTLAASGNVTLRAIQTPGVTTLSNTFLAPDGIDSNTAPKVRGRLRLMTGPGRLYFINTDLSVSPIVLSSTTSKAGETSVNFNYASPLGDVDFSGTKILASVRVNVDAVTGAYARLATLDVTRNATNNDVTDVTEGANYAGGVETEAAGGMAAAPWGIIWSDHGAALRLMSISQ